MLAPPARRLLVASACLLAGGGAGAAVASPADNPATDGAVFAGVTGADPANITTNPAALLRLPPGVHGFTFGTLALEQVAIERRLASADDGSLSAGPTVSDATFGAGVTGGVAAVLPRGMIAGAASLRPPEETIDDPAVGFQTRGSRLRRFDWASIAVGYTVTSRIFVGLSVTSTDRRQQLRFARDTALDAGRDPVRGVGSDCGGAPCGLENPAARELWSVDVEPHGFIDNLAYSVGAMARLPAGVWLGFAVERPWQVGAFAMEGTATIVRAPRDGAAILRGEAVVLQRLPEVWRLGGRGPVAPGWELLGELRWRHLGRTDPTDVRVFGGAITGSEVPEWSLRPTGQHDAVSADVGLEPIDLGQRWRFGARLGVDTGAAAAGRLSARSPWGAQIMASLGAQVRLDRWTLQLGYRFEGQLPTSADPSAYDPLARIACVESDYDYDLPACATVRAGYGTSTAAGTYGRFTHTARVALRFVIR